MESFRDTCTSMYFALPYALRAVLRTFKIARPYVLDRFYLVLPCTRPGDFVEPTTPTMSKMDDYQAKLYVPDGFFILPIGTKVDI